MRAALHPNEPRHGRGSHETCSTRCTTQRNGPLQLNVEPAEWREQCQRRNGASGPSRFMLTGAAPARAGAAAWAQPSAASTRRCDGFRNDGKVVDDGGSRCDEVVRPTGPYTLFRVQHNFIDGSVVCDDVRP